MHHLIGFCQKLRIDEVSRALGKKEYLMIIISSHNIVVEGIYGLSRTYVCEYVRSLVCSPFVIALATSFIIQFQYNFTQVLGMTIPRTTSHLRVIGSRSRSQGLFLEKLCHHSSAFICKPILILLQTNV